jgi:ABC-type transport system involved in cytochrome c biogenesis permease subunit
MSGLRLTLVVLLALLAGSCSRPAPPMSGSAERTDSWDPDVVAQMAALPIQENGRVKPLSVFAAFSLYALHGRRDLKYSTPDGKGGERNWTINPTEWLLDMWCFPGQAAQYPLFRIEDSKVMDAIGLPNDGQRLDFDYLSFDQIIEVGEKLTELARSYGQIDRKKRSSIEEHIVQLYQDAVSYALISRQLEIFQYERTVSDADLVAAMGGTQLSVGGIVRHLDDLKSALMKSQMTGAPEEVIRVAGYIEDLISLDGGNVGLIAPADHDAEVWQRLGQGLDRVFKGEEGALKVVYTSLQDATSDASSIAEKEAALVAFHEAAMEVAQGRQDIAQIARETYYYDKSWHYQSIHYFLLAFVLACVCWLVPRDKVLWWSSMGVCGVALGMLSCDLVLRILITGHPPIKNLYDTFLFIAWAGVLLLMATEFVLPRRIALAAASFMGALLVMFARMYEVENASDTMDPLVAVLDSNFWLATHVTTINIGYAAGLVAAVLANVWIAMRVLRISHPSDVPAKALVRMVYGVTCFGLLFSVVGTILGGVWANDSWGRFWGWDPKENGALMICLGQIALLHARFSGLVRDFGFIVWSGVVGMVVVFSWFHVNLLGVGLHSYGFSSGLRNAVWISYTTQLVFLGIGALDVMLRPNPAKAASAASTATTAAN